MTDIVGFLRARLDEDERAAREAVPSELDHQPEPYEPWYANEAESSGDTIVAMHPQRALAEVEAKRRILDRYEAHLDRLEDAQESHYDARATLQEYDDWTLPALALPYADHPDCDDAWRP